jgi:hypothetical protein
MSGRQEIHSRENRRGMKGGELSELQSELLHSNRESILTGSDHRK